MISIEHYKAFYYAALTGSISKAAEKLHITQPAASRSVKQLEIIMETSVLFRTSKGVTLTTEGKILFEYVEKALNFIDTAEKRIKDIQNMETGEIRISISDTLCKHYLMPYLESFNRKFPDIKISVTNPTSLRTIELLKSGQADIGIVNLPIKDDELIITPGIKLQDCFVCNDKYKFLADRPISPDELSHYPVLLLEQLSNTRLYLDSYFTQNNCSIEPALELGNVDLLVEFAKIGMGISCVIKNFVEEDLKSGKLYELKINPPISSRNAGIVYLKNTPLSIAARSFIKTLV